VSRISQRESRLDLPEARREALRGSSLCRNPPLAADRGQLVLMQNLDRVLNRDDVALTGPVDVVDHGREGRGLAAPGRSGHEDEAALLAREAPHGLGRFSSPKERAWTGRAGRPSHRAALPVAVDPEATKVRD